MITTQYQLVTFNITVGVLKEIEMKCPLCGVTSGHRRWCFLTIGVIAGSDVKKWVPDKMKKRAFILGSPRNVK